MKSILDLLIVGYLQFPKVLVHGTSPLLQTIFANVKHSITRYVL